MVTVNTMQRIIADFHQSELPPLRRRALEVPLDGRTIITVIGPRRAGKTFYLYQIMNDLDRAGIERQRMLYLNFEDERLVFDRDYDVIFDAYRRLYPHQNMADTYIFFDEVQELENWEKFVRRVYDTISHHIVLTGSNSRLLSREIASSLRGRGLPFEMLPLSFAEYLQFHDIPARMPSSSRDKALVDNAYERYLLWGGFPELVDIQPRYKARLLQEYFNVMLYRDLVERYGINDISILKYLLKRLIGAFTKEFSVNKLFNELKSRGVAVGKDSLYAMMDHVFDIYMLARVEKYDPSVVRREMSNKKVYLFDNGFATAMHYSFNEDRGQLLENMVFRHLRGKTDDVQFVRNGWECDFVVFPPHSSPELVQVTAHLNASNARREIKGLQAARQYLNCKNCLLLTEKMEDNVDVPEWVSVHTVRDWMLLTAEDGRVRG